MSSRTSQHQKVRAVIERSAIPMDVENVRVRAGLKNWESTKAILLEMVLRGEISGQKTTKSWIFWASLPQAHSYTPSNFPRQDELVSVQVPRVGQFRNGKKNGRR
jgi:hypothetical protein